MNSTSFFGQKFVLGGLTFTVTATGISEHPYGYLIDAEALVPASCIHNGEIIQGSGIKLPSPSTRFELLGCEFMVSDLAFEHYLNERGSEVKSLKATLGAKCSLSDVAEVFSVGIEKSLLKAPGKFYDRVMSAPKVGYNFFLDGIEYAVLSLEFPPDGPDKITAVRVDTLPEGKYEN